MESQNTNHIEIIFLNYWVHNIASMNRMALSRVRKFFDSFPSISFEKEAVIINKNEISKKIYYIVSGEVVLTGLSSTANRVVLNVYKPGSYIPLALIFNKAPSKYYFITTKKTICLSAPLEKVQKLIEQDSIVQADLIRRLSIGLEGIVDKLFMAYTGTAKQRVVLELLIMQARRNNSSGNFEILVTHDEIAEKCGLSRETVTRALGGLAKNGFIYKKSNKISFMDIEGMKKLIN